MKKTLRILVMLLFCLCPVLLAGCEAVDYFSITAMTSDDSLGRVDGQSEEKIAGETEVTLIGSSFKEENPLLCWIKNNEIIVKIPEQIEETGKRDNTLKLVAGEETEGQYTAIFAEPVASMKYAYISSYQVSKEGVDISAENVSMQLSYAVMSAGTNNYLPFNHDIAAGNANVLYFGGLGESLEFKFQASVTVTEGTVETPIQTKYTVTSDQVVSRTTFVDGIDSVKLVYSDSDKEVLSVTINISKLNTDIFSFVDGKAQA